MALFSQRASTIVLSVLLPLPLLASGCRSAPPARAPSESSVDLCTAPQEEVSVEYLGSGGILIKAGSRALMTAPFFSNPNLFRVGLGLSIAPVPGRIPAGPRTDLAGTTVDAILVGHSHYDHLMDVPSVVDVWKLGRPRAYGSQTMALLLNRIAPDLPTEIVDDDAGDWKQAGRWLPTAGDGSRFRVMALRSEHAPHLMGMKLFGGELEETPTNPPRSAYDWPEGQTYAYVIDVLDADHDDPILRIYYQDAATDAPVGFVPHEVLSERPIDVAVLCAASFEEVDDHPAAIVEALAPRFVLAAHWEDFFREQGIPGKEPNPVPLLDIANFESELRSGLHGPGQTHALPIRGDLLRFGVCAAD